MALTDFFRINCPYGIEKVGMGWRVFNREYLPLGTYKKPIPYINYPEYFDEYYVQYCRLTDNDILKIFGKDSHAQYGSQGQLTKIWFYSSRINPQRYPEFAASYFKKLQLLFNRRPISENQRLRRKEKAYSKLMKFYK